MAPTAAAAAASSPTDPRRPPPRQRSQPPCLLPLLLALLLHPASASLTVPTAPPTAAPSVFYDAFSTRIFDPTGRVLQLEYALEATRRGGAAVGAVDGGLVCLASWTPRFSRRMAPVAQQPALGIWQGDAHVALVASGMATDALALAEAARRECLAHRYIYDSPINVGRLVTKLAQQVHETERARIVPYAVDLLVAGVDGEAGGRPRLYNIGPAGVYGSYRACAVGREADKARRVLMEAELGGAGGGGMAGLRRLAGTVLRALMLTVPQAASAGDDDGKGEQDEGGEAPAVTEDISLVVLGKGVPLTRLQVKWDPRRRRLNVRVPAGLAAAVGGQEAAAGAAAVG